jgi:hypothetical protein
VLSMDFQGWHIWQNTQGRIIANGPTLDTRHMDFPGVDDAVNWLFLCGHKPVARELNRLAKAR